MPARRACSATCCPSLKVRAAPQTPPPSPQALPALGLVIRILCSMHLPCLNLFLPHSLGAGSTVSTKHGNVNTDYILFICSGAFHSCKPSDMLAELQGRLPIRVELKGLT